MNNILCIPARFNSKRLPGKLLKVIDGKTILLRTYERCIESGYKTVVLTDGSRELTEYCTDKEIEFIPVYNQFAPGGTNSILSCLKEFKNYDNLINVQADAPDISINTIKEVVRILEKYHNSVVTAHYISNSWDKLTEHHVKLVHNDRGKVLYFSRENIPHNGVTYNVHIGIYGFPYRLAKYIASLNLYNPFECENLEQLHWLYHDIPIYSTISEFCHSINTEKDLADYEKAINDKQRTNEIKIGSGD